MTRRPMIEAPTVVPFNEARVQIREYQQWLEAWDKARGWDRVAVSHTLVHALEELGEVARLVLQWEGYKDAESPEKLHSELEEELSDVFVFLFKLAYQTGIDVEAALARGRVKADGRYDDLDAAGAMLARYHARQAAALAEMMGEEGKE
jgi:NTP pyrophosphatase (non-canonical NTP hydrolase)